MGVSNEQLDVNVFPRGTGVGDGLDLAFRYGGEEFMVIMPSAHAAEAFKRAEQWRKEFSSTQIFNKGQVLSATLSAGVATFPEHGSTDDDIWRAADNALYEAKSAGRNCVIVYKKPEESNSE